MCESLHTPPASHTLINNPVLCTDFMPPGETVQFIMRMVIFWALVIRCGYTSRWCILYHYDLDVLCMRAEIHGGNQTSITQRYLCVLLAPLLMRCKLSAWKTKFNSLSGENGNWQAGSIFYLLSQVTWQSLPQWKKNVTLPSLTEATFA